MFRHANQSLSTLCLALALAAVFALGFTPDALAAGAGTLSCSSGGPSGGSLLGNSCNANMDLQHLFTGLICNYKMIIDEVLTYLYCGVSYVFEDTIKGCISLFVAIYGIKMGMGMVQIREGLVVLVKIAFMYAFASQSSWAIGVGYNFVVGLMENSMAWVTASVLGTSVSAGGGASAVFGAVDAIFYSMLTGPVTTNGIMLMGFLALMSKALPPLFGLTIYFLFKSLLLCVRAMLTYLLGISAIAFLIALTPLFMSFMLFKTTFTFFDSWLKHLASFVLQVMLVFAVLAMWIMLLDYLGDFFVQLTNSIRVLNVVIQGTGQLKPEDSWGLCPNYNIGAGAFGPTIACGGGGGEPIMPTQLVKEGPFIYFFVVNIVTLILAVYAFDTLIRQIPMIAQQLSGPKSISAIGGSVGPDGPDFPGLKGLEDAGEKASLAAASGNTKTQGMLNQARGKADKNAPKTVGLSDLIGKRK